MKILPIVFLISIVLIGCNRTAEKSLQPARDYILIQEGLSNVVPLLIHTGQSQAYLHDVLSSGMDTLNSCATYTYLDGDTIDISVNPMQYEITYSQCNDYDQELKNGTLQCILYEYFNVDSADCFVAFDAFSINDNILSGSITIKRIGGNDYKISTSNLKLIIGTREINYSGSLFYSMGTGGNANLLYDNYISVSDEGSLNDRYGNDFTVNTEGISKELNCEWFNGGFVELEDIEGESIVLDYGAGACDNSATVTYSGEDVVINL
ncbi:MAG: hypothetical protein H6600_06090 [Flavobacteriales bacterium]|nr:hypothetical protein [Flavobacteriales bacterium]MCB9198013.1 hypothetical protein [Flavobacteriales bacterium]